MEVIDIAFWYYLFCFQILFILLALAIIISMTIDRTHSSKESDDEEKENIPSEQESFVRLENVMLV